jgi:multicomponent Na+:H+ antiporter subunit B
MNWLIELVLYLLLLVTALLALGVKNLLAAAVAATSFSLIMAVLFISMGAVDVGFTEAVVGAGIVGIYFIAVIFKTTRKSRD